MSHPVPRLLSAGLLLSGAALCECLLGGAAGGAIVGTTMGGVGANFLHQTSDSLLDAVRGSNTEYLRNEQLRILIGRTIADKLKTYAEDPSLGKDAQGRCVALATKAEAAWERVNSSDAFEGLDDQGLTSIFVVPEEKFQTMQALEPEAWETILLFCEHAVDAESTTESLKRLLLTDVRHLKSSYLTLADRKVISERLSQEMPAALYNAFKDAFSKNDPAYAALQLRLMRTLIVDVKELIDEVNHQGTRTDRRLNELAARLEELASKVDRLAPPVAQTAPIEQQEECAELLKEIQGLYEGIRDELKKILADTGEIKATTSEIKGATDELKATAADTRELLQSLTDQGRVSSHITSNLPARNLAFVGRTKKKEDLVVLLQRHEAVAILGGAGMGKSELALEIAHETRDQWAGVWWIDASSESEETSLLQLYELITGTHVPRKPEPLSDEDPVAVHEAWLKGIRQQVTARLSTAKHS